MHLNCQNQPYQPLSNPIYLYLGSKMIKIGPILVELCIPGYFSDCQLHQLLRYGAESGQIYDTVVKIITLHSIEIAVKSFYCYSMQILQQ